MQYQLTVTLLKNDVVQVITDDGLLLGIVVQDNEDSVEIFIEEYNRTVTYTREDVHLIKPL